MLVNWDGDKVVATVLAAAEVAVNETAEAASARAKANHPGWQSQSGALEAAIHAEPAEIQDGGSQVVAEWGAWGVIEAAKQELGTARMPANPYLRPAADAEYPSLSGRIQAALGP